VTMGIVDRIELVTHVHATEDEHKVIKALLNLIPPSLRSKANISSSKVTGYFGNTIRTLRIEFRGKDAEEIANYLLSSLDNLDKELLRASLEDRFKDNRLFIRFNKQMAYRGSVRIDDGDDVIKVVIRMNHWRIKELGLEGAVRWVGNHGGDPG